MSYDSTSTFLLSVEYLNQQTYMWFYKMNGNEATYHHCDDSIFSV